MLRWYNRPPPTQRAASPQLIGFKSPVPRSLASCSRQRKKKKKKIFNARYAKDRGVWILKQKRLVSYNSVIKVEATCKPCNFKKGRGLTDGRVSQASRMSNQQSSIGQLSVKREGKKSKKKKKSEKKKKNQLMPINCLQMTSISEFWDIFGTQQLCSLYTFFILWMTFLSCFISLMSLLAMWPPRLPKLNRRHLDRAATDFALWNDNQTAAVRFGFSEMVRFMSEQKAIFVLC